LRHLLLLGLILVILGAPGAAAAEPQSGPARWEPPATMGPIVTDTAVPAPTGEFSVQPYVSLSLAGGNLTANWRRVSARGNFTSLEFPTKFTYGLAPNLEVYLSAAVVQNWARGVEGAGAASGAANFGGLGDLFGVAKYQLLAEGAWRPTVTVLLGVTFPTGHHFRLNGARLGTDALGSGTFAFTPGLNLSKWLGPVCLYANLWYSFPTRDPGVVPGQQAGPILPSIHGRDQITFNLAAEWVLAPRWVALLEVYSTWDVGPLFRTSRESLSSLVSLLPGLECLVSDHFSLAAGVAVDLAGKNSPYDYTPILTALIKF
jgi:hypothetical protein